jgi:serine-type D-Ala-D-Ala carboxypeptidase (penicillin-binding protein 5/6)
MTQRSFKILFWPFLAAGIIISWFFANDLSFTAASQVDFGFNNGRVLGAIEQVNHLPLAAYNHFHPENYLPLAEDKKYFPLKDGDGQLSVAASSSLVMDSETGELLWGENVDQKRPIASISKLMSALVFLDSVPDWTRVYKMKKSDVRIGGRSYVYEGEELTIGDLFHLSLVASDNTAVIALASSLGLSEEEFVVKMNQKAEELGLLDTYFQDATGLDARNVSTVKDVAVLAKKSLIRKDIRETVLKDKYQFKTLAGRAVSAVSTDALLKSFPDNGSKLIGGKTGYTAEAGYCFVGGFVNHEGRGIITVVFGARTDQSRFRETSKMADWAFSNFKWQIAN